MAKTGWLPVTERAARGLPIERKTGPRGGCSICAWPDKKDYVNRKFAAGMTASQVQAATRSDEAHRAGIPQISYPLLVKHRETCLLEGTQITPDDISPVQLAAVVEVAAKQAIGEADPDDLAVMVRRTVAEKLRKDELRVTVQHGLQAQKMLDVRAEREADRSLQRQIARALGMFSNLPPARLVQAKVVSPRALVEGSFEEADPGG